MSTIEHPTVLGIDIGGSHITAALVDLETRSILADSSRREAVNSENKAEEIIASWCELIKDSFNTFDVTVKKIGIAMPGPFDYKNGISLMRNQSKFSALYQLNIKDELSKRLAVPVDHIRFVNDAVSFLQGEVFCGAGQNYNRVLGLTLGTGLGSAIHITGKTEDADLWNSAFKDGIAEDYLSTRWFLKRYTELSGKIIEGVKELARLADSDKVVNQIFLEFSKNLAEFVTPLVKKNEIECVVIGGNISNAFHLFLPELQRLLTDEALKSDVKIAYLKEDASLIGAASCWENSYILNELRHE